MVNLCSYNIRGLNKKPKQADVRSFLLQHKISFVGLIETRVKHSKAISVSHALCRNWVWDFNYDHHNNGRIWVGWNPNIWDVTVLFKSAQLIHCQLHLIDLNVDFFVSIIYGFNSAAQRRPLWSDLVNLSPSANQSCWCVLGDFNVTKSLHEAHGTGGKGTWDVGMQDFKDCLSQLHVDDIHATGPFYTWWNGQDNSPLYKKLDRALGNASWFDKMSNSFSCAGPRGLSDHNPIILCTGFVTPHLRKPFQFFNYMLQLPNFADSVTAAWSTPVTGNPMYILAEKLRRVKKALVNLNKTMGHLSTNVQNLRQELHSLQQNINGNPSHSSVADLRLKERSLTQHLWQALTMEECLAQQKSRVQWLAKGDKNTSFFFNNTKSRWNRNKIVSINNPEGTLVHGHDHVQKVAVDHFHRLFNGPTTAQSDLNHAGITWTHVIPPDQSSKLSAPVTDEEILQSLKSLKPNKSPGPDGFNANFFLHSWDIIKDDFLKAVHFFFSSGCMLKETNATAIALIPKVPNPATMNDYRPISCCNTTYKCISKILANRLKLSLPHIISKSQAAFVPGRRIGDNILLAQELFRGYSRKSGPARCALKIDLQKAFDSVSWGFLFQSMDLLGYPTQFIRWIKACISTASFSVKINGSLCGYFTSSNGIRQGDPLSPYLFVIGMEVLSLLLLKGSRLSDFKFHWRAKKSLLTHLCFADDLLLFCHGDIKSVRIMASCLTDFSSYSGLLPNTNKSQCFLANVPDEAAHAILDCVKFPLRHPPVKFLGVPLITSKLSYQECIPLIDRITARVTSWTNRTLSYAGRIQLITAVLFAIQSFWSAHFILPQGVLKAIQQTLSRFLWTGSSLGKHGAKVAWRHLALPKEEGGLGIKCLKTWNQALILKHLWQVIQPRPTSFWAEWIRDVVLKDANFWCLPIPSDCSWIWKQVLKLRPLAKPFISYFIGHGNNTSLWFDPWHNRTPFATQRNDPLILQSRLGPDARVSAIIAQGHWELPPNNHHVMIQFRNSFNYSTPIQAGHDDSIQWDSSIGSNLKVSTFWHSIRSTSHKVWWHILLWHKLHVPRFSFILWLALLHKLKTLAVLSTYLPNINPYCRLCNLQVESQQHLFFECGYSKSILLQVYSYGGWSSVPHDWHAHLCWLQTSPHKHSRKLIQKLTLATIVYMVWRERNSRIQANQLTPASVLAETICCFIKSRLFSFAPFHRDKCKDSSLLVWDT